jgi:D-alanine-D-alanine ligase
MLWGEMTPVRPLRIGLVYETFTTYPRCCGEPSDAHAEYEPESTVEVLAAAIELLGHRPVRLGGPRDLLHLMGRERLPELDAALNIAEGYGGRNREAWAPVLLEMAHVPTLGSDALSLSTSLDKVWANRLVARAGVPIAPQCVLGSAEEAEAAQLPADFPLFAKPRWEGTSKGIRHSSRVESRSELVREVARIVADYRQPALVEAFLPGAEYTVTLVGNHPVRVLPVLQRALDRRTRIGVHALESGGEATSSVDAEGGEVEYFLPGKLDEELEGELRELARRAFAALECRDFARADFRLDAGGRPVFLEINPLPTFAIDGSFAILAEIEGRALEQLLADVIAAGLRRLRVG